MSQSYFKVPKTIRLNAMHYFIMKTPNKKVFQQIASNRSSNINFKDFMKVYKDYTKDPYLFLVNDTTLLSANSLQFRKKLLKKWVLASKKSVNNKNKQSKDQYNLGGQTATISALSSGNLGKYEVLTGKDLLPEKDLLEKTALMKRFEYSPLGKELKA